MSKAGAAIAMRMIWCIKVAVMVGSWIRVSEKFGFNPAKYLP